MKFLAFLWALILSGVNSFSQGCFPDTPDTTINLDCGVGCTSLTFRIPDLRETSDYAVLSIPYRPYAFEDRNVPGIDFSGGAWPGNSYSAWQNLPFPFCFYDSVYNGLAIGSNGTVTFDNSMALQWCEFVLKRAAAVHSLPAARFARAMIAGVMHDLDPGDTARVSPNRKVELRIEGQAPCRKAVISFLDMPLWPGINRNCQSSLNTHQIVLHENTGIIDIYVKDNPPCAGSNEGYSTLAIQNYTRDVAHAPRDRNCTQWGGTGINEAYRFLPFGGSSQLVSTQLLLNGVEIGTGGTITPGNEGELLVRFDNICPGPANNIYVFRAVYISCTGNGFMVLTDTAYVNKTNSLAATGVAEPALCASSTGTITVDVPPGVGFPPYQYSVNGGLPQAGNVFTNLPAGLYTVLVTDAGGCFSSFDINVPSVNALVVSLAVTNTSCNNATDGSVTVNVGRGVPPIIYSLNGGPGQASNVFPNLSPGTYFISVADAVGCQVSNVVANVLPGSALTASYTKRDITCFGANDGMINMDPPIGGTAPFQYSLDGINFQASNVFNGLAAGDYLVRFRDARGCTGDIFTFIIEPSRLTATANVQQVRCNSESNGVITIHPQGGSQPYEYSLDGIMYQASNSFNVAAGNHSVYVRDRNGCLFSTTVNMSEPVVLSASAVTTNASCGGGNDGSIAITVSGGNPSYEYSLDGNNFQASSTFNVAPGNYSITVRDNAGCTFNVNAVVGLTNNLTLSAPALVTICEGESTQLLAVSNADQYQWSPANGLNGTDIPNPVASPSLTTQYLVTAILGRCTTQASVVVTVEPAPVPDAGPDGEICVGQSLQLQGSGGVQFEWSPSTHLSSTTVFNPSASPDRTTQYALHVIGTNGCRSIRPDQVTVNVIPIFNVITSPADTVVSTGDLVQLTASSPGINYNWTPATGLSNPNIPNPVANVQSAITYTVIATTEAGCRGEGTVSIKTYKGPEIYVPTAFSPDNDGLNDVFKPFPVGIIKLNYFRIYNRWGQLVYSTTELNKGWDGNSGSHRQAAGVYVWMVQAVTRDDKVLTRKGTVMLVR